MFGDKSHLTDLLFNLCLAFIGGAIKLLRSNLKRKTLGKYIASAITGGFAGLLMYCLCIKANMDIYLTAFATGMAGYMGDSILNFFSQILPNIIKKIFNIDFDFNIDDDNKKKEK